MTADLSPALAQRAIAGLLTSPESEHGVREWVRLGSFQLDWKGQPDLFYLRRIRSDTFLPFLAHDFWKVNFASMESFAEQKKTPTAPRAIAWTMISQYYSAFFAAHSIMRLLGRGTVRLEGNQVDWLTELGSAYGIAGKIDKGLFTCTVTYTSADEIDLEFRRAADSAKGDHQTLWKVFLHFLDSLVVEISREGDLQSTLLVTRIIEIKDCLRNSGYGDGGWLSSVRNDINYKQDYGLWYPHKNFDKSSAPKALYYAANNTIRLDVDHNRHTVRAFYNLARLITLTCADTVQLLARRQKASSSPYLQRWRYVFRTFLTASA